MLEKPFIMTTHIPELKTEFLIYLQEFSEHTVTLDRARQNHGFILADKV